MPIAKCGCETFQYFRSIRTPLPSNRTIPPRVRLNRESRLIRKRRGKLLVRSMSILSMRLGMAAIVLLLSVSSGQAVTCQEVRGLSATELAYWAERLQVPPSYLAKLLDEAFCKLGSRDELATVPDYKSRPPKFL